MTDDRMARPFSGEIMAGGSSRTAPGGSRPAPDIIDADYVTLPAAGAAGMPRDAGAVRPQAGAAAGSPGMDILKGGDGEARRRERAGPLFWAGSLFIVLAAFWVSGGHALVSRREPANAAPAHAAAMRIANVASRIERHGDRYFLLVDGEVANDGGAGATLHGLEISVAGKDGRTTRYFLGTSDRAIGPGGRFAFSSRLEAPKDGVDTVTVDFRKEGDL